MATDLNLRWTEKEVLLNQQDRAYYLTFPSRFLAEGVSRA